MPMKPCIKEFNVLSTPVNTYLFLQKELKEKSFYFNFEEVVAILIEEEEEEEEELYIKI